MWVVTFTSFLTDVSSEMLVQPVAFLSDDGVGRQHGGNRPCRGNAESVASLLKVFSGYISDKLRARKWLAVAGYALSTLSKPFYLFAQTGGG